MPGQGTAATTKILLVREERNRETERKRLKRKKKKENGEWRRGQNGDMRRNVDMHAIPDQRRAGEQEQGEREREVER